MSVVELPDTRSLGRANFALLGEPLPHGTAYEAWTHFDLDAVLGHRQIGTFLAPMVEVVRPGDTVEVYQVARAHIETPDRDPLAAAVVLITEIVKTPKGLEIRAVQYRPVLRFAPDVGSGIVAAHWNGRACVFRDGRREAVFDTDIEALEAVEVMNGRPPSAPSSRIERPRRKGAEGFEREAARQEDLYPVRCGRISSYFELRTLHPIDNIIAADWTFFRHVVSPFKTCDRLSIVRYASDKWDSVIEQLTEAVVDVEGGRLHVWPQRGVEKFGEPERGLVLDRTGPREWVVRRDGRTLSVFNDEQRAGWFLSDEKAKEAA